MKMIMVVPKSAWGKEDHEIEEIIAKERAEKEAAEAAAASTAAEEKKKVAVAIPPVVKSLKDIAVTLVEKKLDALVPDTCCLRPQNCIIFKRFGKEESANEEK